MVDREKMFPVVLLYKEVSVELWHVFCRVVEVSLNKISIVVVCKVVPLIDKMSKIDRLRIHMNKVLQLPRSRKILKSRLKYFPLKKVDVLEKFVEMLTRVVIRDVQAVLGRYFPFGAEFHLAELPLRLFGVW